MAARTSNSVLRAVAVLQVLAADPSSSRSLRGGRSSGRPELRRAHSGAARARGERSGPSTSSHPCVHARSRARRARLAAQRGYRVVDDALPEMERLSQDLGLGCLAGSRVGDDMVMLAVTGPPQPFGSASRSANTYPSRHRWGWHSRVGRRRDHRGVPRLRRPHARRGRTTAYSEALTLVARTRVRRGARQLDSAIDSLNASERQLVATTLAGTMSSTRSSSSLPSTTTRCCTVMLIPNMRSPRSPLRCSDPMGRSSWC